MFRKLPTLCAMIMCSLFFYSTVHGASVEITYPGEGDTVSGPLVVRGTINSTVTVVSAELQVSDVSGFTYFNTFSPFNSQTMSTYTLCSFNWPAAENGSRYLKLKAGLSGGSQVITPMRSVTVYNGTTYSLSGGINYGSEQKVQAPLHIIVSSSAVNQWNSKLNEITLFNFNPYSTWSYYDIPNISSGTRWVFAYLDLNNNGQYNEGSEPSGTSNMLNVSSSRSDVFFQIYNPTNFKYLFIKNPSEYQNLYSGSDIMVEIDAYDSAGTITKAELYVDDPNGTPVLTAYNQSLVTWYWNASQQTAGQHKLIVKTYTGNYILSNESERWINLSSSQIRKIYGQVYYENPTRSGTVYVRATMGSASNTTFVSTVSLASPGYYELSVPSDGSYYVQAFMDGNSDGSYTESSVPKSSCSGPYIIAASSGMSSIYGVQLNLWDPGSTMKYKMEGDISYNSSYIVPGPLRVVLHKGTFPSQTRYYRTIWGPAYPAHYVFDSLDPDTYYVMAYVDSDDNNNYEEISDPAGKYDTDLATPELTAVSVLDHDVFVPSFGIYNPGVVESPTGPAQQTTGPNTVKGNISYLQSTSGSRIIVRAYDQYNPSQYISKELYSPGYYEINNLPSMQNCIVEAFVDFNYNWQPDFSEPQSKSGVFVLSGTVEAPASVNKDLALEQTTSVAKSTGTVIIRGRVKTSNGTAIGGAIIKMYDTGGFEDHMWENDVFVSSVTSGSSWSGSGNDQYNLDLGTKTVMLSINNGPNYGYEFRAAKEGYKFSSMWECYREWDVNNVRYIDITLEPKPVTTVTNLSIEPSNRVITPNNDGQSDRATFRFNYSVQTTQYDWSNGAQMKLVVDTNDDGQYTPMNWGIFVNIDGKEFIKWNSQTNQPDQSIYVDFMNPDYTKLKGPLSYEEKDKYSAGFDATMDWWVDGWSLQQNGNVQTSSIEMAWEGRDNRWQTLKNGTYKWKLMVDDPGNFDAEDGLISWSSGTISVQTPSITGKVVYKDTNGTSVPIAGAKVNAGGPGAWGETFTDTLGNYEISGLRISNGEYEKYHVEASADRFTMKSIDGISIPESGAGNAGEIVLSQGMKVSGIITIPNPPRRGTLRDSMGNQMWDLWGRIEAWRTDGPGWYSTNVRIPLEDTYAQASLNVPYEIYLEPNAQLQMQVYMPGYVSKTIDMTLASEAVTKDISLTKSAVVTGKIKLPVSDAAGIAALVLDAQKRGCWNSLWINLNADSIDHRNRGYTGVGFDFYELRNTTTTEKEFRFDTLVPGTTYNIMVESMGMFAMKNFTFYVPASGSADIGTLTLSFGAKLTGKIIFADNISDRIESARYGFSMDQSMMNNSEYAGKVPIYLNVLNTQSFSYYGMQVWVSSTSFPAEYTYEIKGLSSGKHEIEINGIRSVDMSPSIENRVVIISSAIHTTANAAIAPDIIIRKPTGILSGTITDRTGTVTDWSKVGVTVVNIGSDGGEPTVYPVTGNGNTGTFKAENLVTGTMIVWGTQYDIKPGMGVEGGGIFGRPSGNVSTFIKMTNTQSGGATTYITAELKAGSDIYVNLYCSTTTMKDIIAKTTTYTTSKKGIEPALIRVQPLMLRKMGESMEAEQKNTAKDEKDEFSGSPKSKEIAFGGVYIPALSNDTTAVFKVSGLEEGIYFVYPMVNSRMLIDETWVNDHHVYNTVEYKYASSPLEQYVVLGEDDSQTANFTFGEGVTLNGSVTRPSGSYDSEQVVSISLRDTRTNSAIYTYTMTFSTSSRSNTQSFSFANVATGKYVLAAKSVDYKIYSKLIEITAVSGTETLSPIKMDKGATISGKIVDENGNGISEGLFIQCESYPYKEGSYRDSNDPTVSISSATSNLGQFAIRNLPGGTYMLKVSMTENARQNLATKVKAGITVPDVATSEALDVGTIQLKKATLIKGRVKNAAGQPLPKIHVVAFPLDAQQRENMSVETDTDKDGAFKLRGIDASAKNWEVRVNVREDDPTKVAIERKEKYGRKIAYIDVTQGITLGDVVLPVANSSISGKISTIDGGKITLPFPVTGIDDDRYPAALILLQDASDLASGDPMSGTKALSSGDGTFNVDGLVTGNYTMKAFVKRYATHTSTITIKDGMNALGTITLEKGATVSGNIRTISGGKISKNDAKMVIAASKDFKKIVFGSLTANPSTNEVDSYEIVGLEPAVRYFITLVAPETGKVFVDHKSTAAASNVDAINHPITYIKIPPQFEAKVFKVRLPGFAIKGNSTYNYPSTYASYGADFSGLDMNTSMEAGNIQFYDVYYVYAFATQPLMQDTAVNVVSTVTANGVVIPMTMSDNKKAVLLAYVPWGDDMTRGHFILKFNGRNSEGVTGETSYKFYLGEDGRSEKIINPMIGGNLALGEGDSTGIEIPSGLELQDDPLTPEDESQIALSSGTKVSVIKVTDETVRVSGSVKYGPKKYSPSSFSTKQPAPGSYPGTLMSDMYDLQVKLVTGPLATIAQNSSVGVKIKLSTAALNVAESNLRLYHYDETSTAWVPESGAASFDWSNFLLSMDVNHFSKFAVFRVVGTSTSTVSAASDLSNVKVYPNPYKAGDAAYGGGTLYFAGLTAKTRIRIFNIAGELIIDDSTKNDASTDTATWDMKNDDGNKVASGVYIYYITNPDNGGHKAVGKFAIIK